MRIRLSQLRRIIREVVEEAMVDELDMDECGETPLEEEDLDQSEYSRGGAGGNRAGDSWDEPEPDKGYVPDNYEERMKRMRDREDYNKKTYGDYDYSGN